MPMSENDGMTIVYQMTKNFGIFHVFAREAERLDEGRGFE